jgi:hypothetical protein
MNKINLTILDKFIWPFRLLGITSSTKVRKGYKIFENSLRCMNLVRKIVLLQVAIIDGRVAVRSHTNSENIYNPAISTALSEGLLSFMV